MFIEILVCNTEDILGNNSFFKIVLKISMNLIVLWNSDFIISLVIA